MLANSSSVGGVVADSALTALNLPQPGFARIVRDEPRYYPYFAQLLIEQFAMAFRYLGEVQGYSADEWLLARLKHLVATRRRDHPANTAVDEVTVSQADLATMIGVTRQTLSNLLSRLEQRGLIEVKFRGIRVLA